MSEIPDAAQLLQVATSGLRDARAWRAVGYLMTGPVATVLMFVGAVVTLSFSLALCVIGIGIPLTVAALGFVVGLTGIERQRVSWLGEAVPGRELSDGSLIDRFKDRNRWRHAGFAVSAMFPALLAFVAVVVVWAVPIYFLTVPTWSWAVDAISWPETIGLAIAGAGLLCLAPWASLGIAKLLASYTTLAVGPDRLAQMEQQVTNISQNRAEILAAVAAERRRIERNLHDGVQQRLVALGIDLGLAESKLETDPDGARALLDDAREKTRASIGELRVIGRGLHPAILGDRGLDAALSSIVSDTSVPVELRSNIAVNPPVDIQEAAFFVVSEALTNVMKHSNARLSVVDVTATATEVEVSVYDDGTGGATMTGTGLAGISARVRGMGGSFDLVSPPGGPTTVAVVLPYDPPSGQTGVL
ncbi:MAG: sensor histidine kinase [Acidimicrobiales bacterium]